MKIRLKQSTPKPPTDAPDRRAPERVLGLPTSSASEWGSTTWKRLRLCPREYALHRLGLRPQKRKEALDTGLLLHYALEVYFNVMMDQQRTLDAEGVVAITDDAYHYPPRVAAEQQAWSTVKAFENEPGYAETFPKLEKLLIVYFEAYRRTDRWRVIAVEETLGYDDGGLAYTARLDLIVHDVDLDRVFIVEHKTARFLTDDLLMSYEMDLQILGQVWLFHTCIRQDALPAPYGGVIVDIITTGNNPPRVHRQRVIPSRYHVDSFEKEQRKWVAILPVYEELDWPKAFASCAGAARFFKSCQYYDLCHGHPQHDMADWKAEFAARGAPYGFNLVGQPKEEAVDG